MAAIPRVLIAVDEPYVGQLLELHVQSLGFEADVADCEAEAYDGHSNGRYCMAVTIPAFDKLTTLLTKSSPPTPTILLCYEDAPDGGPTDGEHVQLMSMPCPTERLLLAMASMASAAAPAISRPRRATQA